MSRKLRPPSFYDIAHQFTQGFVAGICVSPGALSESDHWLAGWDAGYAMRAEKNKAMNEHLISIGVRPMEVVRPAATRSGESER